MLCLQVMQQQLKRPNLKWRDVENEAQMMACVNGVESLARGQRDQKLQLQAAQSVSGNEAV